MTKIYTSKIPSGVKSAMEKFTSEECYLIRKRKKGLTGKGVQGNCHFNVEKLVSSIGGQRVPCWLLYRNKSVINKGIWVWSFHSVWRTPENEVVDVTQDQTYEGSDYTTVWFDKERDIDLTEGTSYNNIVIFENETIALAYSQMLQAQVDVGTVYWTTSTLQYVIGIENHSGKYRWLDDLFPNNILMLEKEYDCKAVNGKLIPNNEQQKRISTKLYFDYSVS
jgi:hypothetical protein